MRDMNILQLRNSNHHCFPLFKEENVDYVVLEVGLGEELILRILLRILCFRYNNNRLRPY